MVRSLGHPQVVPAHRRPSRSRAASPFVGRDDELHRLDMALALAADGQGGTIFLTGQPGIGKTRLAQEALGLARQRGFTTLQGRAFPLRAGLAYAPFLDAFAPLLRRLDPAQLTALVDGLPDLGRLFGDLRLPPPSFPSEGLGDPALEKTRLFEAVSRLLERLTQASPVALFIDDVHWADPATLELLHYLAFGPAHERALLLVTYNDDALNTSQSLRSLVISLQRPGLAGEIVLPRLEPDAVEKLVKAALGGEAPGGLLALLEARAGGTPLFVEALIAALMESGSLVRSSSHSQGKDGWVLDVQGANALPPSVRRIILDRLERLEPIDRRVLDVIAVMGDATSHTIVLVASGLEEGRLLEALQRLRAGGLVSEGKDGSEVVYSVTHPLIQEVAYSEIPEMARRRVHLAAIEAIESFQRKNWETRPNDVNRLARHYRGAGSEARTDRALAALVAAGDRALAIYANEEAARNLEAALAVIRHGGGWRVEGGAGSTLHPPPSTLPHVLERLGEAWERIGRHEAAIEVWNEALVLLSEGREQAGDSVAASRLRRQLALAEWNRGYFDTANRHLSAGFAGLAGREPCQELADLHFVRYRILSRLGDAVGVAETAAALLSVAERLASPRAKAEANLVAFISCLWQNDVTNARERALNALTIAESFSEGQDLAICCEAHATLVLTGMRLGDHHFMRSHCERGMALAQRLGIPSLEAIFWLHLAYANFLSGAWDESLRCNMKAITLARRIGYPRDLLAYCLAERGIMLALRGDLPEAEGCISEAKTTFAVGTPADRAVFGLVDVAETALALERGQVGSALGTSESFIRTPGLAAAPVGLTMAYMPAELMLLAEAQVAAGDPESALETAEKLIELGPTGTLYLIALASRAEGLARHALSQREDAMSCLTRSHETFIALGMPFEAARASLEQAVVAGFRQPHVAAAAAKQSLAIFDRLGAQRYAGRARRLLTGLGFSSPATRRQRLGGAFVSARELEIARLVVEGLTTSEIAERLSLSPRTVTTHFEHIYARLGIRSRAALARCVIEAGLL